MRKRITERQLEMLIYNINLASNNPVETYTKDENGRFKSNIGNYHLGFCYGGVELLQIADNSGSVNTPLYTGVTTKREMYGILRAFLAGLKFENSDISEGRKL